MQALLRLYTVLLPHLRATALRSMPAWARVAAASHDGAFADAVAYSSDVGALGPAGVVDPGALRSLGPSTASRCKRCPAAELPDAKLLQCGSHCWLFVRSIGEQSAHTP